jgi:hypothetical protein
MPAHLAPWTRTTRNAVCGPCVWVSDSSWMAALSVHWGRFAVVCPCWRWFAMVYPTNCKRAKRQLSQTTANLITPCPIPGPESEIPTRSLEVVDRLKATLAKGEPIIAAGAGTGISAKFIEKGGADLIIIYNSGRFRMSGPRLHLRPDGLWRCQCHRHGDRRV